MSPSPPSEYTLLRAADAPDFTGEAPGAFLGYGRALGSGQLALTIRLLEAHTSHLTARDDPSPSEEIDLVLEGAITVEVGDDVLELGPHDAVLIPPGTPRAVRNDTNAQAAFLIVSRRDEGRS